MMSKDEAETVSEIYRRLIKTEDRGWNTIDDYLEMLDYLDNDQLHRDADVIFERHTGRNPRCDVDHPNSECLIPKLVDSVGYIIELYKESGNMHDKNKYILQYYLALNQSGMIVAD